MVLMMNKKKKWRNRKIMDFAVVVMMASIMNNCNFDVGKI